MGVVQADASIIDKNPSVPCEHILSRLFGYSTVTIPFICAIITAHLQILGFGRRSCVASFDDGMNYQFRDVCILAPSLERAENGKL